MTLPFPFISPAASAASHLVAPNVAEIYVCSSFLLVQVGNVGAVYLAMGDFDSAVECHTEHLRLAKMLGNKVEGARAYSNLGSSHHYRRCFDQARTFHEHVLRLARELGDRTIEARAYAGLGHAARCMGDSQQARRWHEKQLDMALMARDKVHVRVHIEKR